MKKYLFIIFPLIFILFTPKTYALLNNNTSYNLTMPNYNTILNRNCGNENVKQVIDNFISTTDFSSTYYEVYIDLYQPDNPTQLTIYLITKGYNVNKYFHVLGQNSNQINAYNYNEPFNSNRKVYVYFLNFSSCSIDITTSNSWLAFLDLLNNNHYVATSDNIGRLSSSTYYSFPQWYSYTSSTTITNDSNNDFSMWYYFSSKQLIYYTGSTSANNIYYKKLYITDNNTYYTYGENESLPSYYDLYPPQSNDSSFIEYLPSLGTIYSNFSPNDINNFDIDISFNTNSLNALEYRQNLSYTWSCYGRINNNNNYYSYEKFSYCDFQDLGDYDISSNLLKLSLEDLSIYDSSNNLITNFSNYDKLFIYIDFQYNDFSLDSSLNNLSIRSNFNNYYSQDFKGPIYDTFSLPLYFKMFVSSSRQNYSYFSIKYSGTTLSDKYLLYKQQYNTSSLNSIGASSFVGSSFQQLYVNNDLSLGYMFYHQISSQNSGIDLPSIDIILNESIIISINNSSNTFYYYDSNGSIVNSTINIDYDNKDNNDFNLDYYFNKVYEYELEYFDKINKIHDIVQDFYDSLPIFIQTTFFILFILLCSYLVYREARR